MKDINDFVRNVQSNTGMCVATAKGVGDALDSSELLFST